MKDYDEHKESSYLKYQDVNNLFEVVISQKMLIDLSKLKIFFNLMKILQKVTMKKVMKHIFLNLISNILKIYYT